MRIRPFTGYIVAPERAADVITPAYEALTPERWRRLAAERPDSYLHVVAAEPIEPPDPTADRQQELARGAARLREMIRGGVFRSSGGPCVIAYRVVVDDRRHTGIVVDVDATAYHDGDVKPHEDVRDEKAERFAAHLATVGAVSTPALLTTRGPGPLTDLAARLVAGRDPDIDARDLDGARHQLWISTAAEILEALRRAAAATDALYVADGHHRIEAVARVAKAHGPRDAPGVLALVVAPDELELLPFHRRVGIGERDPDDVLGEVRRRCTVERIDVGDEEEAWPPRRGEYTMLLDGAWYRVVPERPAPGDDPVATLDPVVLQQRLLGPVFGVADPTSDPRLEFVPGVEGPSGLAARCARDPSVGFVLHAAAVEDVLRVADAGRTMPPKSTWFEPKLPSGLLVAPLAEG